MMGQSVLVDDAGDRAAAFVDQQVVTIVATHPVGSLSGFVQVFGLPVLNDITIVAILGRYYAAFLVPGGVGTVDVLHGRGNGFRRLNSAAALIVGLRCHCCTGCQQSCAHSHDKFRFHELSFMNAKLVAEPQVKDSGKCQRTHLPGGETVPKAWLLQLHHRRRQALCV